MWNFRFAVYGSSFSHVFFHWAEKKADWFDPNVARDDEFFGKRRHEDDPERKKLECKW